MKRAVLNIGELAVSKEPACLETILGSCVAVCLWDEQSCIGGLNHYLLPCEPPGTAKSTIYGTTSIDSLVEQIVRLGANIRTLRAQIFGGGSLVTPLDDIFNIGTENILIARERLRDYGIPVMGEYVRDKNGIRVVLDTVTGETTVRSLGQATEKIMVTEVAAVRQLTQLCKSCIMCGNCIQVR